MSESLFQFGGPWLGYNDTVPRHLIDRKHMAVDSENWLLNNEDGSLRKRKGMTSFLTSISANGVFVVPGALQKNRFRGESLGQITIESMRLSGAVVGKPLALCGLMTDEMYGGTGLPGAAFFWYYDAGSAVVRLVCDQMVSKYPPTLSDGCLPTNDITPGSRFNNDQTGGGRFRHQHAAGSRGYLETDLWVYFPTYGPQALTAQQWGVPHRWNKQFPTGVRGLAHERVRPTGHQPAMWCPRVSVRTLATAPVAGTWPIKAKFYLTCLYEWEDGSLGPMAQVRPPATTGVEADLPRLSANVSTRYSPFAAGGIGLIDLDTGGPWGTITITDIPCPPHGVRAVWLLRSKIVTAGVPDPTTIGLIAVLPPGQKTYIDEIGVDTGNYPLVDDALIHNRHIMPPRAKHIWTFDGRVAIGDLRANPVAMFITYVGSSITGAEHNDTDVNVAQGVRAGTAPGAAYVRVCIDHLTAAPGTDNDLCIYMYVALPATSNTKRIRLLSAWTLQQVVDAINCTPWGAATATTGPWGSLAGVSGEGFTKWAAQLAPGVDGNLPASVLATTPVVDVNTYGPNSTEGFVTQVGAAHRFGALATVEALDPYVGPDTENVNMTNKVFRTYGGGAPGILLFNSDYLSGLSGAAGASSGNAGVGSQTWPGRIAFTQGGPDLPSMAANSWVLENIRDAPEEAGRCMGGAGLPVGSLVLYANAYGVLRNIKDGRTGLDEDYQLDIKWWGRGCISSASIAKGPGFVVFLSQAGIIASDGDNELLISGGLFDAGRKSGILAYEIQKCIDTMKGVERSWVNAASSGVEDFFNCAIIGSRILISFRSSSAFRTPNVWMELDFSPGTEAAGLRSLLNPANGKPFGWSAPLKPMDTITDNTGGTAQTKFAPSAMGVAREFGTGEERLYGYREYHVTAAESGNVWTLEQGYEDNAADVAPVLFTKTETSVSETVSALIAAEEVYLEFININSAAGFQVHFARDERAHTTNPGYFYAKTLPTTFSHRGEKLWQLPQAARTVTRAVELKVTDSGVDTANQSILWGIKLRGRLIDQAVPADTP